MEIIKKLTTKNCYKNANKPRFIVVHETDNTDKGADALRHAKALANGNLSTSVHYFVDDKRAVQVLDHKHGAWAVGKSYGTPIVPGVNNYNSINIEICVNSDGNYTKARANCIELVKYLMRQTGIPHNKVIRHYDAKRKTCPRKMVQNPELWADFKRKLLVTSETETKSIDTAIVFENDVDKIAAQILNWKKKKAVLLNVKDLKGYKVKHIYAIGSVADKIKSEVAIKGKDRFETVQKVLDYIK